MYVGQLVEVGICKQNLLLHNTFNGLDTFNGLERLFLLVAPMELYILGG
jgi:hypothetical protein